MITNNILEIRINIDKIILMIYIDMTWSYITFFQEFERIEYEKKNIYSITFIDKTEMRELKKLNSRYQMIDNITLNEFLIIKGYRQQLLNIYYNKKNIKMMIYEILNENHYNQYNIRN